MLSSFSHPDSSASSGAVSQPEGAPGRVVISATFTAEPIGPALEFWVRELGLDTEIQFAPYNQVFQQLLDPLGMPAQNRGGVNVLLIRFEDWAQFDGAQGRGAVGESANRFVEAVRAAAAALPSPLIILLCPPTPGFDPALQAGLEETVVAGVGPLPQVQAVTTREIAALYPVEEPHDPHADELGHVPYTPLFFAALATMVARRIHALSVAPYKVIALDCDETLWEGVCGEDGPQGVKVDEPHRALQEFMRAQQQAGMLLCLCSKNNQEDVADTFRCNPGMPLHWDDIVARRINWASKAANLAALADELDLGLDSFIFVDDNPKECDEVRSDCPEVLALPLPADAREFPEYLRHLWAFDHSRMTEEDRNRSALYAQRQDRRRALERAPSLGEFLVSLRLEVRIGPMLPQELPRVAQLTQRTNQMNLTTIRRNEAEIQALIDAGKAECLTVHVADRFGSYGLTGVILFATRENSLRVDTLLLSCRVLGRGVEHRMLRELGRIAAERGLDTIEVPFVETQRNLPALLFLESVGLEYRQPAEKGSVFHVPAAHAARLEYRPAAPAPKVAPPAEEPAARARVRQAIDYVRLATALRTPAAVLAAVREANRRDEVEPAVVDPPRTDLERQIAEIWCETLGLKTTDVNDNFFDAGGHSLLAVQLLSRVRQVTGADLSLEVVYAGDFTVAELARAVELKRIEETGADQYAALLEELEGLSDEEVRALLAEEEGEAK